MTNMYATPWRLADRTASGELPHYLRLWRFEQYYRLSADQLPGVLCRAVLDASALTFRRWQHAGTVTGARMWLFRLPSGQIVASLSLDARCELIDTIDLLEDCYFGDVQIGNQSAAEYAHALAVQQGADGAAERDFLPERHQMVLGAARADEDCEDELQRLIYRADLPYRKEYSAIRYPAELNRRPGWLAAVGPYVSVVCGHSGFIENAVFLSAVQAVAAAAQLRAIRQAAYADVRLFRDVEAAGGTTRDRRRMLEHIADQLGDLELELSYSVEASADLGLLVPSLRVESFHNALYESMSLAGKAVTAGRMLQRLGSAISAELTAIESIERRADENRRIRYAVAVGFVSAVAIPASLILAFLGINASQVNPARSMFSHHYLGMYLTVAALIVLGARLAAGFWVQQRRDARHHRVTGKQTRWAMAPDDFHA
ncbi:MAG TPA: hypothetical protein VMV92_09995 [Streptosporangiaceae bacterium]|nr:hypothetical protein [Streptosporangiaceae bacterium]